MVKEIWLIRRDRRNFLARDDEGISGGVRRQAVIKLDYLEY